MMKKKDRVTTGRQGGVNKSYALAFIVVFAFCLILFYQSSAEPDVISRNPPAHPVQNGNNGYNRVDERFEAELPPISAEDFTVRANKRHEILAEFVDPSTSYKLHAANQRCSLLNQHQQLVDPECNAAWLHKLKFGQLSSIKQMWGFEDTHMGAITFILEGGVKSMFKPCTTKGEETGNEVIASHIDHVLGWGQVAPITGRRIRVSDVERLLTTAAERSDFEKTKAMCAHGEYFEGPMMGWMDGLVPVRTLRKYKDTVEEFTAMRSTVIKDPYPLQMQTQYHAFYWLVNILRHGKDEFVLRSGDLLALDLDRSKILSTTAIDDVKYNYSWCSTCYMSKKVYLSFKALSPTTNFFDETLGALVGQSLSYEDVIPGLWNMDLSVALNFRVSEFLRCIDACIRRYGEDNVLINVPRVMTDIELVRYYVSHSVYKNQNGQRAPSQAILDEIGVTLTRANRPK